MKTLNSHRIAKNRTFQSAIDLDGFSNEEQQLLRNYGAWMEALAKGRIEPYTKEQSQFIEVANKKKSPVTKFELVWQKYCLLAYQHQEKEKNRIMELVLSQSLNATRLQMILDNSSKFGFSKDELNLINELLNARLIASGSHGVASANSLVVFSTTDGQ